MSEYQLLGLDDYVYIDKYRQINKKYATQLEDYKDCLPTGKTMPNITELTNYSNKATLEILARVFSVSNKDDWSNNFTYAKNDGDRNDPKVYEPLKKYPELISTFTHGAVLKDDLNNTIILGSSTRNEYFRTVISKAETDLFQVQRLKRKNLYNTKGSHDLTKTINTTFKDKQILNIIKNTPINKQKVNYPIVIDITLEKDTLLGIDLGRLGILVSLASIVLTTIGFPEIAVALQSFYKTAVDSYQNGGDSVDMLKDVAVAATSILGANETTAKTYIEQGVEIVDLYNKKDYTNLSMKLNQAVGDPLSINDKLKSATEYYNSFNNSLVAYNLYKKTYQASQDALLTNYSVQAPNQMINMLELELKQNPSGGQFMNYITQIACGRAADKNHLNFAGMPPIETLNGSIAKVLLDSGRFNTPELFKFVLDMEAGGQVDDNILNYLLIDQIETQIREYEKKTKGLGAANPKRIFLPYAIDPIKGSCIAKELNTSGYEVVWDGGRIVNNTVNVEIKNNPISSKYENYYLGA